MKTLTRNLVISATVLGISLAAGAAAARPYGMGQGACAQPGNYAASYRQPVDPDVALQRMESHLQSLKTAIGITADQEDAWNRFSAARLEQRREMLKQRQEWMGQVAAATAQDRMQLRIERAEQRVERMKARQADLNALYEVLTPQQQAAADLLIGQGRHKGHRVF